MDRLCSEFSILGLTFSTSLTDTPSLNFNKALDKVKKVVNPWSYRQLMPLGKITVVKSLILFICLFLFQTLIYIYLWGGKPDKVYS